MKNKYYLLGINRLRAFYANKILPQTYDDSLSFVELIYACFNKLNEVIDRVNTFEDLTNELVEVFNKFDEHVKAEVTALLQEWYDDGTLQEILQAVSSEFFEELKDELEEELADLKTELEDEIRTASSIVYPLQETLVARNAYDFINEEHVYHPEKISKIADGKNVYNIRQMQTVYKSYKDIYVDAVNGLDTNTGEAPAKGNKYTNALKTLDKAFELTADNGYNEFRIWLKGNTSGTPSASDYPYTYTFTGVSYNFLNCHIVTRDGNVKLKFISNDKYPAFYGGHWNIGNSNHTSDSLCYIDFQTNNTWYFESASVSLHNCHIHSNHSLAFIGCTVDTQYTTFYTQLNIYRSQCQLDVINFVVKNANQANVMVIRNSIVSMRTEKDVEGSEFVVTNINQVRVNVRIDVNMSSKNTLFVIQNGSFVTFPRDESYSGLTGGINIYGDGLTNVRKIFDFTDSSIISTISQLNNMSHEVSGDNKVQSSSNRCYVSGAYGSHSWTYASSELTRVINTAQLEDYKPKP